MCNLYRLGEKLVFFGPCSQWGRKPVSERGWAYFTVLKRIAHLSRPGVRVRDEHYSLLLPHFFSYFPSKYLCVSSAQLRKLTDPVHGWGLKDIPGGQLSELWWQTNLYSIGACAMFVFHMLAYPEFSALTHLTSLEISIPKPLTLQQIDVSWSLPAINAKLRNIHKEAWEMPWWNRRQAIHCAGEECRMNSPDR